LTLCCASTTLTPVWRAPHGIGPNLPVKENCGAPVRGKSMAKISFTLKGVTKEIQKAEKKLRAIRSKVTKADQKKIDLNLRTLKKSFGIVAHICRPPTQFGQSFTTKPK
jgi:hypothetical protein